MTATTQLPRTGSTRAATSLASPAAGADPDRIGGIEPAYVVDVADDLVMPALDIVVPVYNEQDDIGECVERLSTYLLDQVPYSARITIADNASTDATRAAARWLAENLPGVRAVHLDAKGRGRALKAAWLDSDADVLVYTDVDLATGLPALPGLVAPLVAGHAEVAIGSRLSRGSRVVRGAKREFISRCYNLGLRTVMGAGFTDAQCGFKAIRADVAARLVPLCEDDGWFFDTELLLKAERAGLRIHEVTVDWIDDPDSSVDIVPTAMADIRGCARVARGFARGDARLDAVAQTFGRGPLGDAVAGPRGLLGQVLRFGAVGVASTIAYAVLYALFATVWPDHSQLANVLALLITAVANTATNRRITFGVRGRTHAGRHQAQGLVVFAIGWALTAGALALVHDTDPDASTALEIGVLTVANLVATAIRFLGLRLIFRRTSSSPLSSDSQIKEGLR